MEIKIFARKLSSFYLSLFSVLLVYSQTKFTVDNIYYEIIPDSPNTVKVTGKVPIATIKNLVIPDHINDSNNSYSVTVIGTGAFYNVGLTDVILPNTIKTIEEGAFSSCKDLKSIRLNNGLLSIGDNAFAGSSSLTEIEIPNTITSIGTSTFYYCTALQSIILHEGLKTINSFAFQNTGLTSIRLPSTITSIGHNAFIDNNQLTSFTSLATTPPTLGEIVFRGAWQANCDLFVPTSALAAYLAADQWKDFRNKETLFTNSVKLSNLTIYPNPAKDFVTISNIKKGANISIFDASAKLVFQTIAKDSKIIINTSTYNNGLYLVNVDGKTSKLIVVK